MEWENKFSSIVKETESNLAKVKQRLNSSRNVTFSNSFGPSSSSSPFTMTAATTANTSAPFSAMPSHLASSTPVWMLHGDFASNRPPSIPSPAMDSTLLAPKIDYSPAVSVILSERIEAQAKTIATLNGTIKSLENERDQFNRRLKQISEDVTAVNNRVAERGVHLHTERKVEQWKQEVMSELAMLRNVVHRNQDSSSQPMDNIYQMKRVMKDEFDSLRRDIDYMKERIDKMETSYARMERSHRESSHRQDRLESGLNELGALQRSTSQNLMNRSMEQPQVGSLRNSLKYLEDKLNNLETKVHTSPPTSKQPSPKRLRKKPQMKKRTSSELLSPNLSDLDLSDDDLSDLDLEDTEALAYKDDSFDVSDTYGAKKHRDKYTTRRSEEDYEFSEPGVTSLGLLSDLQSGELSGDTLDHTLSIDEL